MSWGLVHWGLVGLLWDCGCGLLMSLFFHTHIHIHPHSHTHTHTYTLNTHTHTQLTEDIMAKLEEMSPKRPIGIMLPVLHDSGVHLYGWCVSVLLCVSHAACERESV